MTDLRQFNKGRPRLTDAEREVRRKQSIKKSKEKADQRNLSINGEILERLNAVRDIKSKALGFQITHRQLIYLLLTQEEKTNASN